MLDNNNNKLLCKLNNMYSIYIGPSEQPDLGGIPVYKIVNTNTNLIEGETTILPKAYKYCMAFKEEMEEVTRMLETEDLSNLEIDENMLIN